MLAMAMAAVAVLAGCGNTVAQPAGSTKVVMTEFAFSPAEITAPSGKVVFFLVNSGTTSHNMIIRDSSNNRISSSSLVSAGDSSVFTVDNLPVGNYTFFCDQQGHEASGMKGKLTITNSAVAY
jgi:plastocyanin